ncbi:MAG TPA: lytic murein transglycosylase [Pseudonocardiaceae bacterium]|nr:lytic murein transglycosylase [Pseudonocardiaceae bacterium]
MTDLASEDQPKPRPPLMHGRRTRIAVVIMGCVLSFGVPVVAINTPGGAVDERSVRVADDPAGLGATGALPTSPAPASEARETEASAEGPPASAVPTEAAAAELPGIPTPPDLPDGPLGIPGAVLDAYQFAQRTMADIQPGCHLPWTVLAGIGRIESDHASDGRVDAFGNTLGPILGPRLDGSPGIAAVPDTDRGALDGDTVWDRAVGPMQFIPSTWRAYGVDGNGDGVTNPNNIYDATVSTGLYLCAGGADLADQAQLQAAVFRYNHSAAYVDVVLRWAHAYLTGVIPMPSAPGPVPPGTNGNGGVLIEPGGAPAAVVARTMPLTPVPTPAPTPTLTSSASPAPTPTATTAPSPAPADSPTPSPSPPPMTTTASVTTPPVPEPPSPAPASTPTARPLSTTSTSASAPASTSASPQPSPPAPPPTTPSPTTRPGPPSAGP